MQNLTQTYFQLQILTPIIQSYSRTYLTVLRIDFFNNLFHRNYKISCNLTIFLIAIRAGRNMC